MPLLRIPKIISFQLVNTIGLGRRTDDRIIYLILNICQDGALKTNIIQQAKFNDWSDATRI